MEGREAVRVRRVAHRRPRCVLVHVDRRPFSGGRVALSDGGDDPARRRVEEQLVRGQRGAAAADDHVDRPSGRVDDVGGGCRRNRRQRGVGLLAAQRMRTLVMMLVPADDQIDGVFVEQRQPLLPDPEIGAVELVGRRDRDLVHADHEPVDAAIATRRGQLALEPRLLRALRVAAHIGAAAVLVDDVVVGDADHPHRSDRERVPQAARHVGLTAGRRQREIGLISAVPDRPVPELVLVVARRGHPRPVASAAAVIVPEVPPRAHTIVGEVRVTQVTVEEVEERPQPLDTQGRVAARRRTEIVVHERQVRQRDAGRRHVALAQRRGALIAEAREGERPTPARRGPERPELGRRPVVHRRIEIRRIGPQPTHLGMIRVHDLIRRCIGVAGLVGRNGLLERAIEVPERDPRAPHRLQRVPGDDHLGGRIGAELQVHAGHRWCREGIGRTSARRRRRVGIARRGQRRRRHGRTGGGEQFAAAELEAVFVLRRRHGAERIPAARGISSRCAP